MINISLSKIPALNLLENNSSTKKKIIKCIVQFIFTDFNFKTFKIKTKHPYLFQCKLS